MEKEETRLVEEGNTIYEIDLDCMRKKQRRRNEEQRKEGREIRRSAGGEPAQDFS